MTDFLTFKVYLITFCTGPIFKKYLYMDILGPDRGKMTIYGSDFQQVNLTPNGGVSPTDDDIPRRPSYGVYISQLIMF